MHRRVKMIVVWGISNFQKRLQISQAIFQVVFSVFTRRWDFGNSLLQKINLGASRRQTLLSFMVRVRFCDQVNKRLLSQIETKWNGPFWVVQQTVRRRNRNIVDDAQPLLVQPLQRTSRLTKQIVSNSKLWSSKDNTNNTKRFKVGWPTQRRKLSNDAQSLTGHVASDYKNVTLWNLFRDVNSTSTIKTKCSRHGGWKLEPQWCERKRLFYDCKNTNQYELECVRRMFKFCPQKLAFQSDFDQMNVFILFNRPAPTWNMDISFFQFVCTRSDNCFQFSTRADL